MSESGIQQVIQFQNVLLKLTENQGETNKILDSLSKDIKKNDDRVQEEIALIRNEIKEVKDDVDSLNEKARYWRVAFCLVIGAGGIVATFVTFLKDTGDVLKKLFGI